MSVISYKIGLNNLITPLIILLIFCGPGQSQELTTNEQEDILNKSGQLLLDNYVFKEKGENCFNFLNTQLENGLYDEITHPRAFARQLTNDLRGIHRDRHIRLQFISEQDRKISEMDPTLNFLLHTRDKIKGNLGLSEVRMLNGNVGYINIRSFEPLELARYKILNAMHFLEDTDGLILDLRENIGGNPATVQFICSWFFDRSTHLNSIYWRRGDYIEEFWSMETIGIKKRPDLPLYILIGSDTFSAGEEFAYNLKIQNRAILIGEKTAGGANPGYSFRINDRFSIFIPTGRSVNPITGDNWEGKGVEPDIAVSAGKALSIAHEKAQHAARIYREASDNDAVNAYMTFSADLESSEELFKTGLKDSALLKINSTLIEIIESGLIGEWHINELAYRYISQKKWTIAMALLLFNMRNFPDSFNVYDSMGELYMKIGNPELASENYHKSLTINPQNQNASLMLKRLEEERQSTEK